MSDEPRGEFVDTNVLVYLHDGSAGAKQPRALELADRLWDERVGCLSLQIFQELYVTLTRKVPRPLDPATARDLNAGQRYDGVLVRNPFL